MQDPLIYLSYIGIILLVGLLSSAISRKLKLPNILLLLLAGIGIGYIKFEGNPIMQFPTEFITSIAILTLALIVFDSSSRFKLREFDHFSWSAFRLVLIFLVLCSMFLTLCTFFIFDVPWLMALLFSVVMAATSPAAIISALGPVKNKVFELLEIESIMNTPLIVLIPFLILDIFKGGEGELSFSFLASQITPFAQQFIAGIGTGVLVGVILFKIMRKEYSRSLSPLAMISAAILTYVLAEFMGGNGVLAVTTAGLFFGNVYIKHKRKLQEFSSTISLILEILVFVLIGMIIKIPITVPFFLNSLLLFGVYIIIRLVSVHMSFTHHEFTFKEKQFIALNMPKGIAVAVIVLTLSTINIPNLKLILDLILIFMLYSIILSAIITRFSKYFTNVEAFKGKEV